MNVLVSAICGIEKTQLCGLTNQYLLKAKNVYELFTYYWYIEGNISTMNYHTSDIKTLFLSEKSY